MKTRKFNLVLLLFFSMVLSTCEDAFVEDIDLKFCGDGCPSSSPWRVESWDLGLPCFTTKEACLEWAATHGYGDKPCIKCD